MMSTRSTEHDPAPAQLHGATDEVAGVREGISTGRFGNGRERVLWSALAAFALALFPSLASAQSSPQLPYPSRTIRMIVPFAPGGASDVVARVLSVRLGEALGREIVVENRSGASGNIGMEVAAGAPPDGHTLFLGNIGTMAINPAIFREMPVNPATGFTPVTQVADVPSILIASPALPANSVGELVAFAKAQPGVLNFASTGSGALSRLEMEQLRRTTGIDVVHIPYKGGAGPAVTGLLGGETHVMFVTLASAISLLKAGKLKPLGISTKRRIDALPNVPTMIEAGFPEMTSGAWQGIFVPAGTPRTIVDKLHAAIVTTLRAPETVERLASGGVWVVTSQSPDEFAAFVQAEAVRWSKVVRESGATVD
jgi:tripartite-type tricarboxylate transporter receptor subunit TctC